MLYLIAAIFTLGAWGVQAYVTGIKKNSRLNLLLPLFYSITCILFTVDAIMTGSILYIVLNLILLIFLAIIILSLLKLNKARN
jgi:hypothetical protein